jgi:hypothetical protein
MDQLVLDAICDQLVAQRHAPQLRVSPGGGHLFTITNETLDVTAWGSINRTYIPTGPRTLILDGTPIGLVNDMEVNPDGSVTVTYTYDT